MKITIIYLFSLKKANSSKIYLPPIIREYLGLLFLFLAKESLINSYIIRDLHQPKITLTWLQPTHPPSYIIYSLFNLFYL